MRFFSKNRKAAVILLVVVLLVLLGLVGNYGWTEYKRWKSWQEIKRQAQEFERREKERADFIAKDTYGGKTPQETLELFIKALEAGDYELASRYFVVEKQGEWRNKLQNLDIKNIKWLVDNLKLQVKNYVGYYSSDKKIYTIENPAFTELILYPSNIWKIIEI